MCTNMSYFLFILLNDDKPVAYVYKRVDKIVRVLISRLDAVAVHFDKVSCKMALNS